MSALHQLARTIRTCAAGDPDGSNAIRQHLAAALEACTEDPSDAEALLTCLLETFSASGDQGKAVLDDILLELLPQIAPLAQTSAPCSRSLSAFCSLAAAVCSPRDNITAFLEVLGNVLQDSPSADSLQFACNLLLMLPAQVAKLSRRKAENAVECCSAAASLAKVHGQVLAGWTLHQLAQAAQPPTGGSAAERVLQQLDTFLAAHWQAYVEFAESMVQLVLQQEADAAARRTAEQGLAVLVLQLLQHLTATWPPPALRMLALRLLQDPGSAQLMPSTESVAQPAPMLVTAARAPGQAGHDSSNAEAAVLDLLQALHACGVRSWQQLSSQDDASGQAAAAGAGLAALCSGCAAQPHEALLAMPCSAVETVQLACRWCCSIVEASDDSMLAILKGIALLQLAATHAKQLALVEPIAAADSTAAAADAAAAQLLVDLRPCIILLAGVTSQALVQALRSQASVALQQLLQALPSRVCYACLKQLLTGGAGPDVHPEVAALLMQAARSLLANKTPGSSFTPASCCQLVMPWLLQHGAVGWQTAEALPDRANAVCAALAVVRLVVLRVEAAAEADSMDASTTRQLQGALHSLSSAVSVALQTLQAANANEQDGQSAQPHTASGPGDGRVYVPGDAQGSGQAVDAWLAVSRVQDVLGRVLELL